MEDEQIINNVTDTSEASEASKASKVKKQKDPKKVAAGKALARKNAEARKISKEEVPPSESESESFSFFEFNNEIQTAAGFVGAGFVLYHGYKLILSRCEGRTKAGESSDAKRAGESSEAIQYDRYEFKNFFFSYKINNYE